MWVETCSASSRPPESLNLEGRAGSPLYIKRSVTLLDVSHTSSLPSSLPRKEEGGIPSAKGSRPSPAMARCAPDSLFTTATAFAVATAENSFFNHSRPRCLRF